MVLVYVNYFLAFDSERRIFSATECVSAIQGHPRSFILAPMERRMRLPIRGDPSPDDDGDVSDEVVHRRTVTPSGPRLPRNGFISNFRSLTLQDHGNPGGHTSRIVPCIIDG